MIKTRKDLKKYLKIDFIMNFGSYTLKNRLLRFFGRDVISRYLKALRKSEYYSNKRCFIKYLARLKLKRLGVKTGFSIATNVFGYGLVIPHYGTIVVGDGNAIGNYCVLHTSTCITSGRKQIGDFFYLSTGAKVIKDIKVADGITVSANSLLNKNAINAKSLYGGLPAKYIKDGEIWPVRDGQKYIDRYNMCEDIINSNN